MADVIEIELYTRTILKAAFNVFNSYEIFRNTWAKYNNQGKSVQMYHVDIEADTLSGGPTFAAIAAPTNKVLNFATPLQVYARSSQAADTSKSFKIIGETGAGVFGISTHTTDASDGTTAVDLGTWNFICIVYDCDTLTGNLIIDDDGASTTVFWTLALGATATTGIVVVPTGYKGAFIKTKGSLLDVPSNANAADVFKFGDTANTSVEFSLSTSQPNYDPPGPIYTHIIDASTEILFTGMFEGAAVTRADTHAYVILWEE